MNNIYKPSGSWMAHTCPRPLPHPIYPRVYVRDFNNYHTQWKNKAYDNNGPHCIWAYGNNIFLGFHANNRGSLKSASWKLELQPGRQLRRNQNNLTMKIYRKILEDFPLSQHRSELVELRTSYPLMKSFPHLKWNLKEAVWNSISKKAKNCSCLHRSKCSIRHSMEAWNPSQT